jgi:predicted nucleic acid-binding Zn ribbon protein
MTKDISQGKCNICNGTFSKSTMTKHVESCRYKILVDKQKSQKAKFFHLVVEGRYNPEYWMHLEASAGETLKQLDIFLRKTWLECCGHLSAFTIQGIRYEVIENEYTKVKLMNIALDDVLSAGMKFYHEYDFGTTTELVLKVVSERESEISGNPIHLLARNEQPLITCESCGKVATQVCSQCIYEGEGWFCTECAESHECGEEMFLPVVNSPRVGMCGYNG